MIDIKHKQIRSSPTSSSHVQRSASRRTTDGKEIIAKKENLLVTTSCSELPDTHSVANEPITSSIAPFSPLIYIYIYGDCILFLHTLLIEDTVSSSGILILPPARERVSFG